MTARSLFRPGDVVLVVDDEPALRSLLALHLRRLGCEVETAATVADAVEELEHVPVDAIVSDYAMPGGTGLNLLAYVRGRGLRTRFVLTSAALPDGAEAAALESGAVVASKPELVSALLRAA
jgi:CheY-like chemotaxis protein